jgi:hypothetical protein
MFESFSDTYALFNLYKSNNNFCQCYKNISSIEELILNYDKLLFFILIEVKLNIVYALKAFTILQYLK